MPLQDEFEWHILITDIKSSYMYMCYGMSPTFLGFQDNLQNLFLLSYEFRVTYLDQQPVIVEFIFTITVFYVKFFKFLFYTTLWVHGYMKHTITVVFTSKKKLIHTYKHGCMYVSMYVIILFFMFIIFYTSIKPFIIRECIFGYGGGGGGGGDCLNFSLLSLLPERSGLFLEVLPYQVNQWQRRSKPLTICRRSNISLESTASNGGHIRY